MINDARRSPDVVLFEHERCTSGERAEGRAQPAADALTFSVTTSRMATAREKYTLFWIFRKEAMQIESSHTVFLKRAIKRLCKREKSLSENCGN